MISAGGVPWTVLIVDDEPDLCDIVRRMLRGRGYDTLTAGGFAAAVALCDTHPGPIHLVVTDLRMPDGSGTDLAERVQRTRPGTPVLFMSGLPAHAGPVADLITASATVLAKPFTPTELFAAVGQALPAA
mgnify:FL=1